MLNTVCLEKIRNKSGAICGYRLLIIDEVRDITMSPDDLKRAIASNQIDVFNLRLTKDNRLIDARISKDKYKRSEKKGPHM